MVKEVARPDTMNASDVRQNFSETLKRVYKEHTRIVVEKSGIPVAAIVPVGDLEDLEDLDRKRDDLLEAMRKTQAAFADVPEDELEREIAKAVAEVKEEQRRERQTEGWQSVRRMRAAFFDVSDEEIERDIMNAAAKIKEERQRARAEAEAISR